MPVSWMRDGDTLYGVMSGGNHRLIVEPLVGEKGWDWAVWQVEHGPESVMYGTAPTADAAIDLAEAHIAASA